MGLLDRLRGRKFVPDDEFSPMPGFRVELDEVTRFITDSASLELMRAGQAQRTAQEQFLVLDMLAEEGRATPADDGFLVDAEEIARLEDDEAAILRLPPRFVGRIESHVTGATPQPTFKIKVRLRTDGHPEPPRRRGPVVKVGTQSWRLSVPLLRTLRAVEEHEAIRQDRTPTELENLRLVARIQQSQVLAAHSEDPRERDSAFTISLRALDQFRTVTPRTVGLLVEPKDDGSLAVEPYLGDGLDHDALRSRWHQLDRPGAPEFGGDVIRAENTLIILEDRQLAAVREVRKRPFIPREEAQRFEEAPGEYYDPDLVDVDQKLSVRVAGIGLIAPVTFAEAAKSGVDWFTSLDAVTPPDLLAHAAKSEAEHDEIEAKVHDTWERGDTLLPFDEKLVDVSDRGRVEEALRASRERITALGLDTPQEEGGSDDGEPRVTVGIHLVETVDHAEELLRRAASAQPSNPVDYASLARSPLPHQREGIEWMVSLMESALTSDPADPARIQGALLADDMGLGKTYMTLAALAEVVRTQRARGAVPLPMLAVMPVALLENWLREIEETFGSPCGPFDDVVVLQGTGVADYRKAGAGPETQARESDLDASGMVRADRLATSLRVGERWGEARLDRPNVLVLTTYETLRRYQISLGTVDWGVVVLDEAQATKNPEILVSRAAKGLKARFKLLATGTPVENSLRDFWSLLDTAQPNLLGPWSAFRSTWVKPMEKAEPEEHERLGKALREAVGPFMLRRVKEDHLTDLPPKHLHEYPRPMPARQVTAYDEVLQAHRARAGEKGAALTTLGELQKVSLHPGLLDDSLDGDPALVEDSARTLVTVKEILDRVRDKGEKAIVFVQTKKVQRYLALWLGAIYGLRVDIVNGDTPATGGGVSRLDRIRAFEARPGFNVIIMSPLAVGVGLTVVGANHAIHLERHWNPAKEAQATDRIYRIGQTREVHIHYPIALHPEVSSFDLNLDTLLRSKVALKDAVVVPQDVTQQELERALGLSQSHDADVAP